MLGLHANTRYVFEVHMMVGIMPETVRVVVETGNTLPGMPEFVVEKVGLKGSETKFEH